MAIRKARGLTQTELARRIGSTQRSLSYYEVRAEYPPAEVVVRLAEALGVSADQLLGLKPQKESEDADDHARLWRKFRKILALPEKDQRAISRMINNSLVAANGNGKHRARRRQAVGS